MLPVSNESEGQEECQLGLYSQTNDTSHLATRTSLLILIIVIVELLSALVTCGVNREAEASVAIFVNAVAPTFMGLTVSEFVDHGSFAI